MTEYSVFLSCPRTDSPWDVVEVFNWLNGNNLEQFYYDHAAEKKPFNWFYKNEWNGVNIFFDKKEDMELFILMWGEYL